MHVKWPCSLVFSMITLYAIEMHETYRRGVFGVNVRLFKKTRLFIYNIYILLLINVRIYESADGKLLDETKSCIYLLLIIDLCLVDRLILLLVCFFF